MPFQFQPYRGDTGTIADLMMAGPRARAAAIRARGDAQAHAAQVQGQAAQQGAANVGNAISGTVGDLLQYTGQAPQRERLALQNAALTKETRDTSTANAITPMALIKGPNGVATFDRDVLTKEFTAAGIADRLPNILKGLDAADEAAASLKQIRNEGAAGLAFGVLSADSTPKAFNYALQHAVENNFITQAEAKRLMLAVGDDPGRIQEIVTPIAASSKTFAGLMEQSRENKAREAQAAATAKVTAADRDADNTRADAAAAATAADRKADNIRADAAAVDTQRYRTGMLGIAQQNANTSQRRTGSLFDADVPSDYANALDRAILSLSAAKRGPIVALANRLVKEGNQDELKQVIKQAAIEGENVDIKNQVLGRQATMASLKDTRAILGELKAKGIPTNWLTGNMEDLARRLGKTTDPEYVALSNRLMGTLINYRRAATGVSFSAKESADYGRMFPNYRNDLPVNVALLDGLEREMGTYDRTYWEHKLGPDGARLIGAVQAEKATPTGTADPLGILK